MVRVEFKKLYEDSILPQKAHASDAGFDLHAHSAPEENKLIGSQNEYVLGPGQYCLVKCGFGMALPEGYEAQVRPRSGLALKHCVSVVNSPGTIDAGWRSEVGVILINHHNTKTFIFKLGERIAQMVIQKLPDIEAVEVKELIPASERGMAGFGSTGV